MPSVDQCQKRGHDGRHLGKEDGPRTQQKKRLDCGRKNKKIKIKMINNQYLMKMIILIIIKIRMIMVTITAIIKNSSRITSKKNIIWYIIL